MTKSKRGGKRITETGLEDSPSGSKYTAKMFIEAIEGSAGLMSVISRRMGCNRKTAMRWLQSHPTVGEAFENEKHSALDVAESVIYANVQAAAALQEATNYGVIVDSSDARWLLLQLGAERGYGNKAEISGPDGGEIEIVVRYDSEASAAVKKTRTDDAIGSNGAN